MSDNTHTEYEAYSDYQHISREIAHDILDAGRAASAIQRYHSEGGEYDPRQIGEAAATVLTPALMIVEQLKIYEGSSDELDKILDDWTGDDGYIARMRATDFVREDPAFLQEFVRQMHHAGLELGYLQAGREETTREIDDERDAAVDDMF